MVESDDFEPESARIARRLRDDIVDGVRPSGSKLVERELAAELDVSRIPIRDALKTLAAEGLVSPRPRSWAVVREFTPSDVADLNEVRSALEVLTFRLAAQRRTRRGLGALRADLDAELAAARAGDAVRARRAAADFHQTVTSLAANDLLSELEHVMRSRMRWLLAQHDDLMDVAGEHEALYAAIADRDSERAVQLALSHIAASRNDLAAHRGTTKPNPVQSHPDARSAREQPADVHGE